MELIWIMLGIIAGLGLGLWYATKKSNVTVRKHEKDLEREQSDHRLTQRELENALLQVSEFKKELISLQQKELTLTSIKSKLEADNENLAKKIEESVQEFEKNKAQLKTEFENLANKILDNKSEKFTQVNKQNMEGILNPFKEKIANFEKKVDETYKNEAKERFSLQNEVKNLLDMNLGLKKEAERLTKALTGDVKKQGNWGELILSRILESSGLTEGKEYETQYTTQGEDNNRLYPDVVVKLPEDKHLIIDSKVSLVAYERLVNAETEEEKKSSIKQHILSVKTHIAGLADKNYTKAKGIKSPDFVLLFMPIESSFGAAIEADADLFAYAWDRKIVIVSPSTLLATLKTIESIWKQEKQSKNAEMIAREAGNLYDKLEGLVSDLVKLGNQMGTAQNTYHEAFGKLKSGKGNLISRAEKLKAMGAKAGKSINLNLVEEALEEDGTLPDEEGENENL